MPLFVNISTTNRNFYKKIYVYIYGRRGSGMVPFERALVSSYRPSIVTFPLTYVFRRYCRFCAPARTFSYPTSSLPGSRWMSFGLQRAKVFG